MQYRDELLLRALEGERLDDLIACALFAGEKLDDEALEELAAASSREPPGEMRCIEPQRVAHYVECLS